MLDDSLDGRKAGSTCQHHHGFWTVLPQKKSTLGPLKSQDVFLLYGID